MGTWYTLKVTHSLLISSEKNAQKTLTPVSQGQWRILNTVEPQAGTSEMAQRVEVLGQPGFKP